MIGKQASSSAKFKNNYTFSQVVMLAYNIWRYFKIMAQLSNRIAPFKLLLMAAKLLFHDNRERVRYPIHDASV